MTSDFLELLVARHAKSSWKDEGLADHDRPLNARGKRDAPRMGRWLLERDAAPQAILASTAKRARKTAEKLAGECGVEDRVELLGSLYLATPETYVEALRALGDDVRRAMVVGHNPTLESLVERLTGERRGMPTCAVARIRPACERWSELRLDQASQLLDLWLPRELD